MRIIVCMVLCAGSASAADPLPKSFHFPSEKPDETLSVTHEGTVGNRPERWKARMVIDGHLTDAMWPEHPPTVYRLAKNAYLLDDTYSGAGDHVWNSATRKLTPVSRCYPNKVPGLGLVMLRHPDGEKPVVELLDFPNDDGTPRVLWRKDQAFASPLGVWDGALVCVTGESKLLFLEPNWPAREVEYDVGKYRWQPTGDAIRRGKVLLLIPTEYPKRGEQEKEFTVPVAVLNLKTRELKPIGTIPGGWTIDTAIPHPVASAQWITRERAAELPKRPSPLVAYFSRGHGYVLEDTDEIVK